MITRRGFFGAFAALVVGGGAAQLRLTPEPGTWASIECSTYPFWRVQPLPPASPEVIEAQMRELFNRCRVNDDGTFGVFVTNPRRLGVITGITE